MATQSPASDTDESGYAKSRTRFERDTAEHEMAVLRDDGLYRHLRFQKPGTWIYGYDLVTWPGYLAIVGDAGDYLFSRTRDMFEFFESDGETINPGYWGEKLRGPGHDMELRYSEDAVWERLLEWYRDVAGGVADAEALRRALDEQILHRDLYNEHEARCLLEGFEHNGLRIDHYEWRLTEYDGRFLWCCWAIVRGIQIYRASMPVTEAS